MMNIYFNPLLLQQLFFQIMNGEMLNRSLNLSIQDRSALQVKLDDSAHSQKFLFDSYIIPELQDQQSFKKQPSIIQSKPTPKNQSNSRFSGISSKKKQLRKIIYSSNLIKTIGQKFIDQAAILHQKFKDHHLFQEQYISQSVSSFRETQQLNHMPVIQLNNRILKAWEIIMLIIYINLMFWMPFREAFIQNQQLNVFESMVFCFILIDILLKLNKEVIVQGQIIQDRQLIIKNYLYDQLLFDTLYYSTYCCIIFEFLGDQTQSIINIMFFFLNLKKFQLVIQNYQERSISNNDKINLIELIITVLMLAHFMACIWHYVGSRSLQEFDQSWITKFDLENQSLYVKYCYSFYWAATTMATVGYGDIVGQNPYEIICSSILIIFSCGIFAFSINSIGMILNNINQSQSHYKRTLLLINEHMLQNDVSTQLQNKIRNYLKYFYQGTQTAQQKDIDTIIAQLSQNLKIELMKDVRSKVVQNNKFISQYFSQHTQQKLIQHFQSLCFTPLEQIYNQNSVDDNSFYIIQKGSVDLIDMNSGKLLQSLSEGDSFGQIELLTEKLRYCSATSQEFTKVLRISLLDFIKIIKQEQKDFETFYKLKDKLIFQSQAPLQCSICSKDHILWECKKLFYKPNVEKIIKQDLFHSFQEREKFHRQNQIRFQLQNLLQIQQRCQFYRSENFNQQDLQSIESLPKNSDIKAVSSLSQIKQIEDQPSDQSHQDSQTIQISQMFLSKQYPMLTRHSFRTDKIKNRGSYQIQTPNQNNSFHKQYSMQNDGAQFMELNTDNFKKYQYYFPQNNINSVLSQLTRLNKQQQKFRYQTIPSNYRFLQIQKTQIAQSYPKPHIEKK
ncbi:hypothetical protein pb186bvf_009029 [Paramecium bursaria]